MNHGGGGAGFPAGLPAGIGQGLGQAVAAGLGQGLGQAVGQALGLGLPPGMQLPPHVAQQLDAVAAQAELALGRIFAYEQSLGPAARLLSNCLKHDDRDGPKGLLALLAGSVKMDAAGYCFAQEVEVFGLSSAAGSAINGKRGTVVHAPSSRRMAADRVAVKIDGRAKPVALRMNLLRISDAAVVVDLAAPLDVFGSPALLVACKQGHDKCVKVLLERGADPHHVRPDGHTALMEAAGGIRRAGSTSCVRELLQRGVNPSMSSAGNLRTALLEAALFGRAETTRLLLAFGADAEHKGELRPGGFGGQMLLGTARDQAYLGDRGNLHGLHGLGIHSHARIVELLDTLAGWHPLRVVIGSRYHILGRAALSLGTIDTAGCSFRALVKTAALPAGSLWPGSPAPCPDTTVLLREAMAGWSPSRHVLFHAGFRKAIRATVLTSTRLRRRRAVVMSLPAADRIAIGVAVLPELPHEMWLHICSFLLRRNWAVPAVTAGTAGTA